MGLPNAASKTMHKEMRCAIRSSNPWLNARIDVVSAKISISLQPSFNKHLEHQILDKLSKAEELYLKWKNTYRVKEINHLKADLLDKCDDPSEHPGEFRDSLDSLKSNLIWNSRTCLM